MDSVAQKATITNARCAFGAITVCEYEADAAEKPIGLVLPKPDRLRTDVQSRWHWRNWKKSTRRPPRLTQPEIGLSDPDHAGFDYENSTLIFRAKQLVLRTIEPDERYNGGIERENAGPFGRFQNRSSDGQVTFCVISAD